MENTLGIHSWQYDREGQLLWTNCPFPATLDHVFSAGESLQKTMDACQKNGLPALVMNPLALVWLSIPHLQAKKVDGIHVLGPVFPSDITEVNLLKSIKDLSMSQEWKRAFADQLLSLPSVQHTIFMQYGIMYHYCVNQEKIPVTDIQILRSNKHHPAQKGILSGYRTYSSFAYEQEIFKAVEMGNLHYKIPNQAVAIGTLSSGDPLRQIKNETIIHISLAGRAALRGGLPDKTAYDLCDSYIQMVESEEDISNVHGYGQQAFHEFIVRVHNQKIAIGRSREIHNCISYIENHLTEKIDFSAMAQEMGYNRNYLSSKFHKEMDITLSDYIVQRRVELAKIWLRSSKKSIHEIAFTLQFGSDSYFSTVFRKYIGISPSEYRNELGMELYEGPGHLLSPEQIRDAKILEQV